MQDTKTVSSELRALASACACIRWTEHCRCSLVPALLALPAHHQAAVFEALLEMRSLDSLVARLPATLHGTLLQGCVRITTADFSAASNSTGAGPKGGNMLRQLHLPITTANAAGATPSGAYMRTPLAASARAALFLHAHGLPALSSVDLSGHVLRDDGIAAIAAALSNQTGLTRLALERCALHCAGAQVLVDTLPRFLHLRELQLASNGWDRQSSSPACSALFVAIGGLTALTNLGLRGLVTTERLWLSLTSLQELRRLVSSDAAAFVAAPRLPRLQALDLRGSLRPTLWGASFGQTVSSCSCLTFLDLCGTLVDFDIYKISFSSLRNLAHLDLEGCAYDSSIEDDAFEGPPDGELPALSRVEYDGLRGVAHLSRLSFLRLGSLDELVESEAFLAYTGAVVAMLPQLQALQVLSFYEVELPNPYLVMGWSLSSKLHTLVCPTLCLAQDVPLADAPIHNLRELHLTQAWSHGGNSDADHWLEHTISQLTALERFSVTCDELRRLHSCSALLEGAGTLQHLQALSFVCVDFCFGLADIGDLLTTLAAVSTLTHLSFWRCKLQSGHVCKLLDDCPDGLRCFEMTCCTDYDVYSRDSVLSTLFDGLHDNELGSLSELVLAGDYACSARQVDKYLQMAHERASLTSLVLPGGGRDSSVADMCRTFNETWQGQKVCSLRLADVDRVPWRG